MGKVKADKTVVELVTLLEEERIQKEIDGTKDKIEDLNKKIKVLNEEYKSFRDEEQKLFIERTIEKLNSQKKFLCELNGISEDDFKVSTSPLSQHHFSIGETMEFFLNKQGEEFKQSLTGSGFIPTFSNIVHNVIMIGVIYQSEKLSAWENKKAVIVKERQGYYDLIEDLEIKLRNIYRFSKRVQLSLKVEELSKTSDGQKKLAQAKEILANKDSLVESIQKKLGE